MRLTRTHGIVMIVTSMCTAALMCLYNMQNHTPLRVIDRDNVFELLSQLHFLPESTSMKHETDIYNNLPKWLPHCEKIFLDLGANIGVTVKKLFEPEKYPENPTDVFFKTRFDYKWLLKTMQVFPKKLCALGFEPNPKHHARLKKIQEAYSEKNWSVHFFPEAVSNVDGKVTFYTTNNSTKEDWSASTFRNAEPGLTQTPITVQRIRLARFIKTVLRDIQIPLVKMDIEGEEFGVLKDMVSEGLLCQDHIHTILIEFHPTPFGGNITKFREAGKSIKKMISGQGCKATNIVEFDDETYLHDM